MVEDLTVLLVGDDEPNEKLVEQLEKKNLSVEISDKTEFKSLLALVEPHIVVHVGKEKAEETVSFLKETEEVRRVRLIIVADREDLPGLRKLDRSVVVSLLATDIAPSVVAARVLMLAKKGPEKSLRPPSAIAKPPQKPAPQAKPEKPQASAAKALGSPQKKATPAKPPKPVVPQTSSPAKPPKASPPRAVSIKAKPTPAAKPAVALSTKDLTEGVTVRPPNDSPVEAPPESESPQSEMPTMAVEMPIPTAAKPRESEARVILADDDVTRADLVACALRAANIPTRIVPLDAAKTHWPLVREFAPTIVMGDGNALKTSGQVWLQLFQADQALKSAKLVAVPFERLCKIENGTVNLRTLIPQIPQLSTELSNEAKPTTAPALPPGSSPVAAPTPAMEAPPPFEDDDADEFERLTVARPIDDPLPAEASRSKLPDLPTPGPAAGAPAYPAKDSDPPISIDMEPASVRAVFDSLAPSAPAQESAVETPKTPAATEAPASALPKKSGGGGKLAVAALLFLALGGGGAWLAMGKKLPAFLAKKTTPAPAAQPAPTPPESAPAPPPPAAEPEDKEPPPSPEELLWKVSAKPAPECKDLVTNLAELEPGGIQQATFSLAKARKAMVLGELDNALHLMCEAVLVHPESLALEELAALYLTKGSPEQALVWQKKALETRPDRPRTLELGGDIYSQLGKPEEAKQAFLASLNVKEDAIKTLQAVSKQFTEQGEQKLKGGAFAKATLLYRRAATLDQENADAFAGLAATSAAVGAADAAARWAEKTLSLDEGQHVALVVQAALATEAGDASRAQTLTEKALERNPNYLPAHQLLQQLKEK